MQTRKVLAIALSLAVTTTLAGCASAPLTAKDATATVQLAPVSDVIIGDSLKVSATGKLLHGRTDPAKLEIQSLSNGTWKTIASKALGKGTGSISTTITPKTADKVSIRSAIVSGKKTVTTAARVDATPIDIKNAIRTLFYNEAQAYLQSTTAGVAFDVANDYPGLFDTTSTVWTQNAAEYIQAGYQANDVPDLTTISPAPTWTMPATKCNPAGTAPPKGRTFIVTVSDSGSQADAHVTLLDGKVYFYSDYCF